MIAARALGVTVFGRWALVWIIVYSVGAFHAALLQTPVQVLTRSPGGQLDEPFIRSLMRLQVGAVIAGGLLSSGIAVLFRLITFDLVTILALGALTSGFMLVEFNRRAVLVLGLFQIGGALEITRGVLAVATLATVALIRPDDTSLGLLVSTIACVYIIIGAIGHVLVYHRTTGCSPLPLGTTIYRCWKHSRWLVLLALSQRLGPDLITVMVGTRAGTRSVGGLRSMIQILNVFNVAFQTLQVTLPIKIVQLHREHGNDQIWKVIVRSVMAATLLFVVVTLILWLFGFYIVSTLLGAQYAGFSWILPYLGVSYLAMFVGFPFACWAHALHESRYLLIANLSAAVIAQVVIALPIWSSQLIAAVVALVAYSIVEAAMLVRLVLARVRREGYNLI